MRLTIVRKRWHRGKVASKASGLQMQNGKMCCLGFLCKALGKEGLKGKMMPYDIDDTKGLPKWLLKSGMDHDVEEAARINDDGGIAEEDREAHVKRIFAKHKIQVRFV